MENITPKDRKNDAIAWGLGTIGAVNGIVTEFSWQLMGELASALYNLARKKLLRPAIGSKVVAATIQSEQLASITQLPLRVNEVNPVDIQLDEHVPLKAA